MSVDGDLFLPCSSPQGVGGPECRSTEADFGSRARKEARLLHCSSARGMMAVRSLSQRGRAVRQALRWWATVKASAAPSYRRVVQQDRYRPVLPVNPWNL